MCSISFLKKVDPSIQKVLDYSYMFESLLNRISFFRKEQNIVGGYPTM